MFLPVLNAEDGYGLTYGARFALADPAGKQQPPVVPADVGRHQRGRRGARQDVRARPAGSPRRRRIDLAADQSVLRGGRRPRAGLGARRTRAGARAAGRRDRRLSSAPHLSTRAIDSRMPAPMSSSTRASIRSWRATPSTRGPRWDHFKLLAARTAPSSTRAATSGCSARASSPSVAQRTDSSRPLPPYLQPLLGGMANLRGFEAGTAVGDTLVAASAELIAAAHLAAERRQDRRQRLRRCAARSTPKASGSRIRRCARATAEACGSPPRSCG